MGEDAGANEGREERGDGYLVRSQASAPKVGSRMQESTAARRGAVHKAGVEEARFDPERAQIEKLATKPAPVSITRVASWVITISFILALIVVGKSYLVPIFMALVVWYLVNALSEQFRRLPFFDRHVPEAFSLGLSLLFISLAIYFIGDSIVQTVQGFLVDSAKYIPRIDAQIARVYALVRPDAIPPTIEELFIYERFWAYGSDLLGTLTNFAKGLLLVLLYVLFFLIEQRMFGRKMVALGLDLNKANKLSITLKHINSAMRTYLGVKTLTSMVTAVLSWIVFEAVGIDYALFWGFLIFIFNYIPTVGSVVATFMPGLLALVQFETLTPFLVIVIGVSAIQVAVGNILEPRLMGNTLNISPLVVVLSLILWSMLWGIVGMLLSVPITVATIIICAQFPTTRSVAILLSRNGKIDMTPP